MGEPHAPRRDPHLEDVSHWQPTGVGDGTAVENYRLTGSGGPEGD